MRCQRHVKRTSTLLRLSTAFSSGGWSDPVELPGVGPYARDAWAIFVEGGTDVAPKDGHLCRYVEWRRSSGTWGG